MRFGRFLSRTNGDSLGVWLNIRVIFLIIGFMTFVSADTAGNFSFLGYSRFLGVDLLPLCTIHDQNEIDDDFIFREVKYYYS